jgi:N12 class adenine-specific DNA methylase
MKFTDSNQPKDRLDYIKFPRECMEYWIDYNERRRLEKIKNLTFFEKMIRKIKSWMS